MMAVCLSWLVEHQASNRKLAKPWFDSRCSSASLNPWKRHLMLFPILGPYIESFFVRARCCTMLCISHTTPTQKLLCLHVFQKVAPPQRVDCLAPTWETALSVFPKDTATCCRIGSQTKVLQPFDY